MRIVRILTLVILFLVSIYCFVEETNQITTVKITGSYKAPNSIKDKKTILLRGSTEGEFIEVVIKGTIFNLEYIKIGWDDKKNDLVEKEAIRKFNILKDKTIVIKTIMPEGFPSERLKWKSISGMNYSYDIHEDLKEDSNRTKIFILK